MKRYQFNILAAISLLICLAAAIRFFHQPAPPWPGTFTLAEMRLPHERIDGNVRTSNTVVLVSFFSGGQIHLMTNCSIYHDGIRGHVTLFKNVRMGVSGLHGHDGPMPEAQRSSLDAALGRLPVSQTFARDADAFLVSWDDGGKWITRTYDRTKLSPEVLALCNLVGIPPEWL